MLVFGFMPDISSSPCGRRYARRVILIPMSENIDEIINGIDRGLEASRAPLDTGDRLRCLEDEVWADLDESVQGGWRTQEEAEADFMTWRQHYRELGVPAVKSQLEGPSKQVHSDNKRRMRRN